MAPLVWLITGTSSGFGLFFVHSVLAHGDKVIATARTLSKIQHLKEAGADIMQLDVTAPQAELDAKVKEAMGFYGKVDVLVNNAGYVQTGNWEDLSHEDLLAIFNTNVFGPINLTRLILPYFRKQHAGTIVFMGSSAAWQGNPGASAYNGSKAALQGMVEGLQQEMAPPGIKTLLIEAGSFRTELLDPKNVKLAPTNFKEYEKYNNWLKGLAKSLNGAQVGDTRKGVETVVDAVKGKGWAEGKEVPFRLVLGSDGIKTVVDKAKEVIALCEKWSDLF
ncbi:putative secondary metabolism biosynthetic enzyme [Lepraria neglecta]|uniref:Secondary metabolism biosynthetic enzyme n=1 Tax=Lepraria neglecta TaxID=209136 RepID=A0AAE0DRG1_9LECA|nr:putative secondary metabolism biosynthetic enzyme [Lepraria neglecta]